LHEFGRREEASEPEGRDRGLLLIDDIMPSLLNRTQHIIDLSLQAQNRKQEVFQPIARFVQIVGDFMEDKKVRIDPTGDLIIQKDGKRSLLPTCPRGEATPDPAHRNVAPEERPFIFLQTSQNYPYTSSGRPKLSHLSKISTPIPRSLLRRTHRR
jgi:hypothetical protein